MSRLTRLVASLTLLLLGVYVSLLSAGAQTLSNKTYLPTVSVSYPSSVFGVETSLAGINDSKVSTHAQSLGAEWLRLNGAMWAEVEPVRGAGYNWSALNQLDLAVANAKAAGLTPVVIIRNSPPWAVVLDRYKQAKNCAAVADAYLPDFTRFLVALAQHYQGKVNYWEIGNEPDVDPALLPSDAPFGCWGDISDPYYGGERYGRMLRTVVPAIRAVDPSTQIVIGGLLLDTPKTVNPDYGNSELFLEGILRSGAADSFDVVAYHAYPWYSQPNYDHDLDPAPGGKWTALGGWTLGKASYLRGIMTRYGVNKPLWLNETGLLCSPYSAACISPPTEFFEAQADHLVRIMSRAATAGIKQISWYTLEGPGWRSAGLLDANQIPRPAFVAYQRMIATVGRYFAVNRISDYGSSIEAYRFVKAGGVVDVLWSSDASTIVVKVPLSAYRSAIVRDGTAPMVSTDANYAYIYVGFQAVFIERTS
ncbi:MAG: cellulase family glycosylhydrolase [Chloroflexales bacterium]|jgi:Cellulase (glycosyl hydrolase family 5)